ncbi:hypothetical protein M885DRAFT_573565 [Pelagophyceae sp. CCMP2097]|nr:hypothetical protein M885DRAFT_573565 [Pelagophyceae sp. CCMP2097]
MRVVDFLTAGNVRNEWITELVVWAQRLGFTVDFTNDPNVTPTGGETPLAVLISNTTEEDGFGHHYFTVAFRIVPSRDGAGGDATADSPADRRDDSDEEKLCDGDEEVALAKESDAAHLEDAEEAAEPDDAEADEDYGTAAMYSTGGGHLKPSSFAQD